mgnify:CR=1 FL=1
MSAIEKIKAKARADVKHIVLPEGTEPRTVQASAKILKEGVARVTLLGNPDEVRKVAAETGTDASVRAAEASGAAPQTVGAAAPQRARPR